MPTLRVITESRYQQLIRIRLAETGHVGKYEPRHVEGFMRCGHPTLDALDRSQFNHEIEIARRCVDADPASAEAIALTFGL